MPRPWAMSLVLVAASISASSVSSSFVSTSAFRTEPRNLAVVTSRTVRGKASRMIGTPSIVAGSDASADGIDITAHFEHARDAAFDHGIDRPLVFKQRPFVGQVRPAIGHRICKKQMQSFERPDQG